MTFGVQCRGLSVGWSDNALISDFPLDEKFDAENDTLPIIGRTGRGKSTLLYALSGMAQPIGGEISWQFSDDGAPTTWSVGDSFRTADRLRRRRFGFLLQDARLIDCFTVAENLRHTLRLRGVTDNVEGRIGKAVNDMLIEGDDAGDFLGKFPTRLSGGQRQRMALAAAIAHDPDVLFADEPTASLDDDSGLEILATIRRWLDEGKGKRAFVFVTHRVETLFAGLRAHKALELYLPEGADARVVARQRTVGRDGLVATD
jgi:ABC-type lipoprotein export system ATPase subunit